MQTVWRIGLGFFVVAIFVAGATTAIAADNAPDIAMTPQLGVEAFSLFNKNCAPCHLRPDGRTPSFQMLGQMSRDVIYQALTTGPMKAQAASISDRDRALLAAFLPQEPPLPAPDLRANLCTDKHPARSPDPASWPIWGADIGNARFQPNPGFNSDEVPRLKLRWAFAYPTGAVSALPILHAGRLYSASPAGDVFALDARTGCTAWMSKVGAGVRGAPAVGKTAAGLAVFVDDNRGFVDALDAASGQILWSSDIQNGSPGSMLGAPILYEGRIYAPFGAVGEKASTAEAECCTSRGGIAALDATTGKILWKSFTIAEEPKPTRLNAAGKQLFGPAGASVWSAPTIDPKRRLLYVTTGNDYAEPGSDASDAVIAFDLDTGARKWVSQVAKGDIWQVGCQKDPGPNCASKQGNDTDFGMPAILSTLPGGKQVLVAGSKSGIVYAFDPDKQGEVLWQVRLTHGGSLGGLVFGAAAASGVVYVPIGYGASDRDPTGGLVALDLRTGKILWSATPIVVPCAWGKNVCSPAQAAAVAAMPGIVFSGSADGHIRAYSMKDGRVVWDYGTGKGVQAVNGVMARGGPIGRSGQTVAGGMLYLNAGGGYGQGDALLAFSVDGK
jgi:polyvinyl alcohol dehydrogenase (cytochrome)